MRNRRPYLGQGGIWDYPSEGFERREPAPPKTERRLTRSGPFEYIPPEEQVDPKIDRLVWNWVKKNPHNIVDVLTGMYGLAGRDAERQTAVRNALDAARTSLDPFFPARKQVEEIGRRIQDFPPDEENYRSFRQALLNALPNLIDGARKKKEHEKADSLIYLADQIYAL